MRDIVDERILDFKIARSCSSAQILWKRTGPADVSAGPFASVAFSATCTFMVWLRLSGRLMMFRLRSPGSFRWLLPALLLTAGIRTLASAVMIVMHDLIGLGLNRLLGSVHVE